MGSFGNNNNYEPPNDTIFVTGLPEDTTEEQLGEFFGQIGVIKYDKKNDRPKIWIYKDKATGKGKGEATITYDDPPTATSAISWFDGKEFRGSTLKIELAQRRSAPQFSRGGRGGGGRGRGGFDRNVDRGGGGRGGGRPGDWPCPSCNNNNFAYRHECNRCGTQKPASESNSSNNDSRGSHYNNNPGSHRQHKDDRGSRGAHRGNSNYRDNDRGRNRDRGDYRDRDHDRDRDRDRGNRSSGNYGGGGGPSRNHPRDDLRSRPY